MSDIVKQLDHIFKPNTIAVIGASENIAKWGYLMVERPLRTGFPGKIYPVNAQADRILGLTCFPSVKEIPAQVDLAVITTPINQVVRVMEECSEKGVRGIVLISAGFGETGDAGKAIEQKILKIARKSGIRFVGPNGMGIWSAAGNLNLAFDDSPPAGHIAFISQSGTFGGYMAEVARSQGYGLRMFISIGNQTDLTVADYIEYLSYDEKTRAIIIYMEGVKDGRRFMEVCKETLKTKPIIIYKGGATSAGARAAMSHTASIAGSEIVFQSACQQIGLIRTQEAFQTFEIAIAMLNQPLPRGRRVGIVGTGGQGVVAIDACQKLGLEIPELDENSAMEIMKMLPTHAPLPKNPVDFAGGYRTAMDEAKAVEMLMKLDYIDSVITNVPVNPTVWGIRFDRVSDSSLMEQAMKIADDGTKYLCRLPSIYNKPVVCVRWHRGSKKDPFEEVLIKSGIPVYDTPEQCARALQALARYAEVRNR